MDRDATEIIIVTIVVTISGDFFWLSIFPFNVRLITERCIKPPCTAERILISKHPCL